jgi:hypothetical protein
VLRRLFTVLSSLSLVLFVELVMGAKPRQFVMEWWNGVGWRIRSRRSGYWGHAYAEMPTALVAELNGPNRREVALELDRRLKKSDPSLAWENQDIERQMRAAQKRVKKRKR